MGKQPFEDVFIIFFIKLLIFQQNIENRKYNIKEKHVEKKFISPQHRKVNAIFQCFVHQSLNIILKAFNLYVQVKKPIFFNSQRVSLILLTLMILKKK